MNNIEYRHNSMNTLKEKVIKLVDVKEMMIEMMYSILIVLSKINIEVKHTFPNFRNS